MAMEDFVKAAEDNEDLGRFDRCDFRECPERLDIHFYPFFIILPLPSHLLRLFAMSCRAVHAGLRRVGGSANALEVQGLGVLQLGPWGLSFVAQVIFQPRNAAAEEEVLGQPQPEEGHDAGDGEVGVERRGEQEVLERAQDFWPQHALGSREPRCYCGFREKKLGREPVCLLSTSPTF